ncbi:unnamed protein product [Ectocarpus sp. 8 AP-2014]
MPPPPGTTSVSLLEPLLHPSRASLGGLECPAESGALCPMMPGPLPVGSWLPSWVPLLFGLLARGLLVLVPTILEVALGLVVGLVPTATLFFVSSTILGS